MLHIDHTRPARPGPLRRALVLGAQLLAGAGVGAALAYLGMLIGRTYFAGDPAGFGDIVASIGGILIGYPVGVTLGVLAAGRLLGRPGALWATALGAIAGSWGPFILAQLIRSGELVLFWALFFICGLLGALLAHELSARRRA